MENLSVGVLYTELFHTIIDIPTLFPYFWSSAIPTLFLHFFLLIGETYTVDFIISIQVDALKGLRWHKSGLQLFYLILFPTRNIYHCHWSIGATSTASTASTATGSMHIHMQEVLFGV